MGLDSTLATLGQYEQSLIPMSNLLLIIGCRSDLLQAVEILPSSRQPGGRRLKSVGSLHRHLVELELLALTKNRSCCGIWRRPLMQTEMTLAFRRNEANFDHVLH
jgi:hypothetical protein